MATNPYYVVTGAPVTQSRGVSATIRSEYSAIHTGFDAVYVAMLLRGLKGGETWTGTHVFTGATVTFATQSASDNSTKAATTAYADGAVLTAYTTLNAAKANIASPTFTGTPAAPTAVAGTSTTQLATTAFVAATAFSSVLPGQTGNAGKFVTTDGSSASWAGIGVSRSTRTSNTILAASDSGTFVDITSGTFTQTFTAAATLASGWYCYLRNSGTGDVTLDPNASETIDGLASYVMYPGECRLIVCDGSNFYSTVLTPFSRTILTTLNPFTTPPGYAMFGGMLWGGGGSGGKTGAGYHVGGGGGGACVPFTLTSAQMGAFQTITIGAGGAAVSANGSGNAGGTSSIGTLAYAYGGGAGAGSAAGDKGGGAGGGAFGVGEIGQSAAGNCAIGGGPGTAVVGSSTNTNNSGFGGGAGSAAYSTGGHSAYGGGGGSHSATAGSSLYGGGGGGGVSSGNAPFNGGASVYGGAGGAGVVASDGTTGTVPGGGGGATHTGTNSGAGGAGKCIIWGIV